jgi:hypothetical protein
MHATLERGTGTHKWKAVLVGADGRKKTIQFGDNRYEDYTQHGDKKRRDAYRRRHVRDTQAPGFPLTPGGLSWYVLWGDSTDLQRNWRAFLTRASTRASG